MDYFEVLQLAIDLATKHGKHNQKAHGRRGAGGDAGGAGGGDSGQSKPGAMSVPGDKADTSIAQQRTRLADFDKYARENTAKNITKEPGYASTLFTGNEQVKVRLNAKRAEETVRSLKETADRWEKEGKMSPEKVRAVRDIAKRAESDLKSYQKSAKEAESKYYEARTIIKNKKNGPYTDDEAKVIADAYHRVRDVSRESGVIERYIGQVRDLYSDTDFTA